MENTINLDKLEFGTHVVTKNGKEGIFWGKDLQMQRIPGTKHPYDVIFPDGWMPYDQNGIAGVANMEDYNIEKVI